MNYLCKNRSSGKNLDEKITRLHRHLEGKITRLHSNLIFRTDENRNATRKTYSKNKQYSDTSSPRFHHETLSPLFYSASVF